MLSVSFHFHGYQPGDIVRWSEPDPLRTQTFEERRSPVVHRVGHERIAGRNWTDGVLRTYGRLGSLLDRASGAASVDIEPQTLVWLLERDPAAYQGILAAWERGTAGFVMTPPFHPILPHHHRLEREALFDLMIDFYAGPIGRMGGRPVGLWLPEAAYSRETWESFRMSTRQARLDQSALAESLEGAYLVTDARQFSPPPGPGQAWVRVEGPERSYAMARDHPLSGEFAFGGSTAAKYAASLRSRGAGSLLVANDLESLLANPTQAERFETIVESLRHDGVEVVRPVPPADAASSSIVDYSSWSDYDDMLSGGVTSDTRWTGIRRSDGTVVSREHRGRPMSQLWKHGFGLATERIETAVRRRALHLLRAAGVARHPQALRRLAVAYGRHLFGTHYRAHGLSTDEMDFAGAVEGLLGGKVEVELAGFIARGYVLMLMGLRSDPRFWDNPDTRVTFQNVVLLVRALRDLAEASVRSNEAAAAATLRRLLQATFLDFSEWHGRGEFEALQDVPGQETTEVAWYASLGSEVPSKSPLDVMKRAALYALALEGDWRDGERIPAVRGVVADTGHIAGEAHGEWANPEWCEHRAG
jgi:hypothetical protein